MFYAADRVLVGIMRSREDFRLARDAGWYRIPQRSAPPSTTDAAVLAFYFTAAFGKDKWAVHWYAEVRGYELVRRRDLLPDQPDHPRADEPYYKLQIGPLIRREPPIPSRRWRRITFIETTWDRFAAAEEINDLFASGNDGLYVTLKESGFFPERDYILREGGATYRVDLAIPCRDGLVAIATGEEDAPPNALRTTDPAVIAEAVRRLGGPLRPATEER